MNDHSNDTPEPIQELTDDGVLKLSQAGTTTVLGFGGSAVPSDFNAAQYRDAVSRLLKEYGCKTVAFDLPGVTLIPSGMLGFWASLHDMDVTVELYNASEDIRDVLAITKLNQWIELRDVNL